MAWLLKAFKMTHTWSAVVVRVGFLNDTGSEDTKPLYFLSKVPSQASLVVLWCLFLLLNNVIGES